MKNGLAYIAFSDERVSCLFRRDRNAAPLMLSAAAATEADGLAEVLRQAEDAGVTIDRAVVAVDGRECILRNYRLPIQGRRQVEQAVEFELDEDLPVSRSTLVCDHFRGLFRDGMSYVPAVSLQQEYVSGLIDLFETQGVVVEKIDVDVAAFARACLGRFPDYERCVGLEIGRSRTLCCILADGKVQSLAVIPWGESDLVEGFAAEHGLPVEEVDRIMLFAHDGDKGMRGAFRKHLARFIRKTLREVLRVSGDEALPTNYVLSGEIVRVQALRKEFEEVSGGYLEVWDELSLALGDEVDEGQRGSGLATTYGVAEDSGPAFNLRKDEFAYAGAGPGWMREAVFLAVLVLCVVLAWGGYAFSSLLASRAERDALTEATMEVYRQALPEVSRNMAAAQYHSILASRIEEIGGVVSDRSRSDVSIIETLRAVSDALDAGIDVEFMRFNLDARNIDLQGETGTLNDVESVRKAIVETAIFQAATIKNAKADKRTKRIHFEIEVKR